jgi:hypothetical protein
MSIQLFAQLCESFLDIDEASTAMSLIGNHPGAQQIIKKLHSSQSLSHNQDFSQIRKISWNDLKQRWPAGWVLCTGPKGTGAIFARNGNYHAFASTGEEPVGFQNAKGGNVLDFLAQNLGGKWENFSYWIGTENKYALDKRSSRKQNAPTTGAIDQRDLMKKFRPLWAKAVELAIGDCKGMVTTMVKNDAFEKASRKLQHLQQLERVQDSMLAGDEDHYPDAIKQAINQAVLMAAHHYYPEQTGEINRSRYGGSASYASTNSEGPGLLLKDIGAGDQKKLGTVLGFFKRTLISG